MKKTAVLILAMFVCAVVWAQKPVDQKDPQPGAPKENKPEQMMPMRMDMMKHFQPAQMVAGADGGVIVLKGNKLFKYDKDLTLTKQVELPGGPGQERMLKRGDKGHQDKACGEKKGSSAMQESGLSPEVSAAGASPAAPQKK